jgi:serine/threonine protein kinase
LIGLRVGPFEISRPAAVPAPGAWFHARRTSGGRAPAEVLVRVVPPDAPPAERAALQREYEILKGFEDPRIPVAVGYYEGAGALAVTAPEGPSLRLVIEQRAAGVLTMKPATALDVAIDLADAVQHAHHRGRIHGALGAHLVSLGTDGRLCVWGFSSSEPHPDWIAPERTRGEPASPATDQWGVCAVLAAMVTGRAPGSADAGSIAGPIEAQWPALGRLLRKGLDPRPENRFPGFQALRQELLALARQAGGTSDRKDLATALSAAVRRAAESVAADGETSGPTVLLQSGDILALIDASRKSEVADKEPSEVTGSEERTTLFSASEIPADAAPAVVHDADVPSAREPRAPEAPSPPVPAVAPAAVDSPTLGPADEPRDPLSDTGFGKQYHIPLTDEEIRAHPVLPDGALPPDLPEAPRPTIERVAPWIAVAMVAAFVLYGVWVLVG